MTLSQTDRRRALRVVLAWRWLWAVIAGALIGTYSLRRPGPFTPTDFARYFKGAGLQLLSGHLNRVFSDSGVQSGPLQLVWQAGWWKAGHSLGLPGLEVLGAATGAGVVALFMLTARVALPADRGWTGTLAGIAAALGLVHFATLSGHPSEVVIPCLWVMAAALAARRPLLAGTLIGVGTGWETWAVLGVAVLAAARPLRAAAGAAIAAAISAAWFVPFAAAGGFRMLQHRWLISPGTWVYDLDRSALVVTWPGRLAQAVAVIAVAAAVAFWLRHDPRLVWAAPLAAAAVRLLSDPLDVGYYWLEFRVPVLLAAVALVAAGSWQAIRPLAAAPLAALAVVVWFIDPPSSIYDGQIVAAMAALAALTIWAARPGVHERSTGPARTSRPGRLLRRP